MSVNTNPINASLQKDTPDKNPVGKVLDGKETLSIYELTFKKNGQIRKTHFTATDKINAYAVGKEWCIANFCRFVDASPWLHDFEKEIEARKKKLEANGLDVAPVGQVKEKQ